MKINLPKAASSDRSTFHNLNTIAVFVVQSLRFFPICLLHPNQAHHMSPNLSVYRSFPHGRDAARIFRSAHWSSFVLRFGQRKATLLQLQVLDEPAPIWQQLWWVIFARADVSENRPQLESIQHTNSCLWAWECTRDRLGLFDQDTWWAGQNDAQKRIQWRLIWRRLLCNDI